MSKKSWYNRKHQFTPYTKADGQAVSDEFDAIQASFERIPEMRDDGKGFKESPLIPEPTDPMHPVPLKVLTETEKSVNNARDDVTTKAQQVAQNAQSVATNTLTATQKADTATQAAASAQSSQQAASNSENMAHKWAANPVNETVQGDKYSAYHYATKAEQSATAASSAAITSKSNADIATSKAEEAIQAANKAKSLADGEVEYTKILHVPSADTQTKGIVLLTNDTGLESESLGLTAKAGKKLAQLIATVQVALNNYIPLKSRSSSVTSTDENGVATPKAVKTAYDKGVEAKEAADNANNNANGRVSKSGDTMTGILTITNSSTTYRVGGYDWPKKIELSGDSVIGNKESVIGFNNNGALHLGGKPNSSEFNALIDETRLWVKGDVVTKIGASLNNALMKTGGVVTGSTSFKQGDWSGIDFYNNSGRYARIESNPHGSNNVLSFIYRESNGSNINVASLPRKNGNILLDADFTYQKIGNFEVRKYPDGTMIQTNVVNFRGGYSHGTVYSFNWAVSFVEAPMVFGNGKAVEDFRFVDRFQMDIKTKSNGSTYYYYLYDTGGEQGDWDMQFLAIGRWRR